MNKFVFLGDYIIQCTKYQYNSEKKWRYIDVTIKSLSNQIREKNKNVYS